MIRVLQKQLLAPRKGFMESRQAVGAGHLGKSFQLQVIGLVQHLDSHRLYAILHALKDLQAEPQAAGMMCCKGCRSFALHRLGMCCQL